MLSLVLLTLLDGEFDVQENVFLSIGFSTSQTVTCPKGQEAIVGVETDFEHLVFCRLFFLLFKILANYFSLRAEIYDDSFAQVDRMPRFWPNTRRRPRWLGVDPQFMANNIPRRFVRWWAEQVGAPEETPITLELKSFRTRKRAIAWCRLQHALRGGWYQVRCEPLSEWYRLY